MKIRLLFILISILFTEIALGQIRNDSFFQQHDFEMARFVGMKYNPIKDELGEPYHAAILDTTLMTRTHYYKVAVNNDSIDFQIHYDKDLWCNGFSFMADSLKYSDEILSFTKDFIKTEEWLVSPNRYLVSVQNLDDGQIFVLFKATAYPIILAQLDAIDFNLRKGTKEYSNYHIERAESGIREVYQTILAASTINSITKSELNTLTKIYKTYTDILNYNGVKISFIQYNENVFFNLIPNDVKSLKHKSVDEVDFTQIENLVAF